MKNPLRQFGLLCGVAILPLVAMAQTVPLTQDSYVVPGTGNNYGTAATINVGGPTGNQALVQFDLTTLPAGTTPTNIASATLAIFVNKLGAAGTINVSEANGSWTELGVNGNNAPVAGAAVASAVSVSTGSDYIYVDASAAVKDWLNGTTNSGFIITPNGSVNVALDSKESTTTSHPATLTITLSSSGATGATGATGAAGATGVAGPAGAAGATGATGVAGPAGAAGATGATGAAGPAGATGATGAAGPAGAAGATGATGAAGPAGATGATGAAGSAGAAGATGATGANGPAGATGATGANGANGSNGATGPTGANGVNGTNGSNGSTGPTGPAGSNGTGSSPTGIPLTIAAHTTGSGAQGIYSPVSSVNSSGPINTTAANPDEVAVVPSACTPSMKIYAYTGTAQTWSLVQVTAAASTSLTLGSSVASCSTTSAVGSSCTASGSSQSAGTLLTITNGSSGAPGSGGMVSAFSCQ